MSFIFTLSDRQSVLSTNIHPPIELDPKKTYVLGFIAFFSYNSIPNVDSSNNKFHYEDQVIEIPEGSYEVRDIERYLQLHIKENDKKLLKKTTTETSQKKEPATVLDLKANNNTLRCEIKSNKTIDFSKKDSIGSLLGFHQQKLLKSKRHISEEPINIFKINCIQIECNLVTNSYSNDSHVHILHSFYPTAAPGFKIIEQPINVIYLPVNTNFINEIVVKITDQHGKLVNFNKELITVRLHLKQLM